MRQAARFLPALVAALAVAACQAAPATPVAATGVAPFPAGAAATGRGKLVVVPSLVEGGVKRQLLATVTPNTAATIVHMKLRLYHPSAPGAARATVDVPAANLFDGVVFDNLEPNKTYRVKATAYASADDTDPINDPDADFVDIVVGDDDRPAFGNLVIELDDVPFAGEATSNGVVISDGGFETEDAETFDKLTPLAIDAANYPVSDSSTYGYLMDVVVAPNGDAYAVSSDKRVVYKLAQGDDELVVVAGDPAASAAADDGFGALAHFNYPTHIEMDGDGKLYITDNTAIRKVDPASGQVTTIAGHPTETGYEDADFGVGETGADARFNGAKGLALLPNGDMVVCDTGNDAIRYVTAAGDTAFFLDNGDKGGAIDGPPLDDPHGITIDRKGDFVFLDGPFSGARLRRGTLDGEVFDFCTFGFFSPTDVEMHPSGHFYVSDVYRVHRVSPDGVRQAFAGVQFDGIDPGNDVALGAIRFSNTPGLGLAANGELFVADAPYGRIWRLFKAGI